MGQRSDCNYDQMALGRNPDGTPISDWTFCNSELWEKSESDSTHDTLCEQVTESPVKSPLASSKTQATATVQPLFTEPIDQPLFTTEQKGRKPSTLSQDFETQALHAIYLGNGGDPATFEEFRPLLLTIQHLLRTTSRPEMAPSGNGIFQAIGRLFR